MAFYRHRLTYDEIAPYIQKLRIWLRTNCPVAKEYQEFGDEAFFMDEHTIPTSLDEFKNLLYVTQNAGFTKFVPWVADGHLGTMIICENADGPMPTITPTHVKLPKLSHLICMTPEDFFGLMKVITTAKNTQTGNSLTLNPIAAGYNSLERSVLYQFFTKMRTNYRMNPDYCDRKWTSRDDIKFLAALEPTRDNQLSAMQYLTTSQNKDLLYFPVETVVNLELDWQQIADDYCQPNPGH